MNLATLWKHVSSPHMENLLFNVFPPANQTQEVDTIYRPLHQVCPVCQSELDMSCEQYAHFALCNQCGHHFVWTARERLLHLADPGTFAPLRTHTQPANFLNFTDTQPYSQRLRAAQRKTGLSDAIIIGRCRIGGVRTIIAILDFHFIGGSMGSVVGEQVTAAFEYALKHHLPIVTVANSGGARMQEGTTSLVQMAKTAAAVERFRASRQFYLSILCDPTTGGVFASFTSLGDMIIAEPQAMIRFAGPRVARHTTDQPLTSITTETLLSTGMLDASVSRQQLPAYVASVLQLVGKHTPVSEDDAHHNVEDHHDHIDSTQTAPAYTPWETVQLARHPDRPGTRTYLHHLSPAFIELRGDHCYGNDPALIAGLGEVAGHKVVFIGHQKYALTNPTSSTEASAHHASEMLRPKPEGYRKALRAMALAARLGWPVITLIDTPGVEASGESESHGLAWSLAQCLATLSSLSVPVIAVITGEWASGGAVALATADRLFMLEHAIYEVIAPEGAAAILYRDIEQAEHVAELLKLTATDCLQLKLIDDIIPEPPGGAHTRPELAAQMLTACLVQALTELEKVPIKTLLIQRYRKYRARGHFSTALSRSTHSVVDAYGKLKATSLGVLHRLPGSIAKVKASLP